ELICDRIALMKSGQIIEQGSVAELTAVQGGYELAVPVSEELRAWLNEKMIAFTAVNGHLQIQDQDRGAANSLIDALRQRNVEIVCPDAAEGKHRTVALAADSEMACNQRPVHRRGRHHDVQCGLSIPGRGGGSWIEVGSLEPRIPAVHNIGYIRIPYFVFRGH